MTTYVLLIFEPIAFLAWVYTATFFTPLWRRGFRETEGLEGYGKQALIGFAVFVGAVVLAFAVVGIAKLAGG